MDLNTLFSEIDLARDRLERLGALARPSERVGMEIKPVLEIEIPRARASFVTLQESLEDISAMGTFAGTEITTAESCGESLDTSLGMLNAALADWEVEDEGSAAAVAAWLRSAAGEGLAYCRSIENIARKLPRGERRRAQDPNYKGSERRAAKDRRTRQRA